MAKKNEYVIDVGGMKSAILKEDGSLTIMVRRSISSFTEHDWAVVVTIRPTGVKNLFDMLTRAAEHRNEADGEQTCPSCDGRGGVTGILSGKYYKCAKCDGTGHV